MGRPEEADDGASTAVVMTVTQDDMDGKDFDNGSGVLQILKEHHQQKKEEEDNASNDRLLAEKYKANNGSTSTVEIQKRIQKEATKVQQAQGQRKSDPQEEQDDAAAKPKAVQGVPPMSPDPQETTGTGAIIVELGVGQQMDTLECQRGAKLRAAGTPGGAPILRFHREKNSGKRASQQQQQQHDPANPSSSVATAAATTTNEGQQPTVMPTAGSSNDRDPRGQQQQEQQQQPMIIPGAYSAAPGGEATRNDNIDDYSVAFSTHSRRSHRSSGFLSLGSGHTTSAASSVAGSLSDGDLLDENDDGLAHDGDDDDDNIIISNNNNNDNSNGNDHDDDDDTNGGNNNNVSSVTATPPREEQAPPPAVMIPGGAEDHGDDGDGGLAEARPVKEEDLESPIGAAEPVDLQQRKDQDRQRQQTFIQQFVLLGVLVVAALVTILVVFIPKDNNNNEPTEEISVVTNSPSSSPTYSLEGYVLSLLPDYTVRDILEEPDSPQALAYQWMLEDPNLDSYGDDRIIQRYALATTYYSTSGPTNWALRDGWLSYDDHECSWFFNAGFYQAYFNMTFHSPCMLEADPTNPDDKGEVYQYLQLESNGLVGPVPEETYLLTNLRDLNVGMNNGVTGTISTRVAQLTKLGTLAFILSPVTGTIPTEIALHHATFENLYLMANRLVGTIPTELGLLTKMIEYDCADNLLTGTLPSQLGNLGESLEIFYFEGQSITGTIPTQVGKLTTVREFGLARNLMTGSLPTELGLLRRAHYMKTSSNQFGHTVPTELGLLSSLIQFDISQNFHTGTIPTELGQLTDLPTIPDFDSYHFDPPRPAGHLILMNFGENDLVGPLPSQIGLLITLEMLQANDNFLTGPVPTQFGLLSSLHTFNLTDNELSGTLPDQTCSLEPLFDCSNSLCGCNCTCNDNGTVV